MIEREVGVKISSSYIGSQYKKCRIKMKQIKVKKKTRIKEDTAGIERDR